ncbi:MAG: hypothetical protein JO112_10970, partial [Planctomycetes bacterium]|nr:hypothetical protein [Planctomycetota bacterium]
MRTFRFCFLWAPALVFLAAAGADGDVIIFKDGFSLQGKITQENEPYKDPLSDNVVVLQKGFIMLDDVARRISFSHTELGSVNKNDPSNNLEIVKQDFRLGRQFAAQLPGILEMDEATPWDAKWERL